MADLDCKHVARVLALACLTEDRSDEEQESLLVVARAIDAELPSAGAVQAVELSRGEP